MSSSDALKALRLRVCNFEIGASTGAKIEPPTVAGYELVERLGKGTFGHVFRARHPDLDCEVALKITRIRGDARDLDEARALAKVKHPNIAHVNAVGRDGDLGYLETDVVEGMNLGAWIAMRPPVRKVVEVLHQIGEGLSAAHRAGVVHKDIKPSNIMIDQSGTPVIVDFGLAGTRGAAGSPKWWAPEVEAGGTPDSRSDQYSFALVCRWALEEVGAPLLASRFTDRALSKNPRDRWPSLAEGLRRMPRRPRRSIGVLGIVVALVALIWVAWAWVLPPREVVNIVPEWAGPVAELVEARSVVELGDLERAHELAGQAWGELRGERPELAADLIAAVALQSIEIAATDRDHSLAASIAMMASTAYREAGDDAAADQWRRRARESLARVGLSDDQITAVMGE